MGLERIPNVYSVRCDTCGEGFDTVGECFSIKQQMEVLRQSGWKGNYKHLTCPKCLKAKQEANERK